MAISTAVTLFGVVFFIDGIVNIISYIIEEPEVRAFSTELIMGILLVILAVKIIKNISRVTIIVLTVISSIAVYYFKNIAYFLICIILWLITIQENKKRNK